MSVSEEPPNKRSKFSDKDLEEMSKEEIISLLHTQEQYIDSLEAKSGSGESLAALEEKVKQGTRREQILVMRLTTKEHEMQEYLNQIQELKQAHSHSTAQLRSVMLDPAVNLMFDRLKKELDETKQKLEQTKNDLSAWKFTADSQTGKRLMAKCRQLLQENEELGKVTSSGRTAKLEGAIALERALVQEMKKGQADIDDFLVELDEDLEGMQSTIYLQQQQLKEAKEEMNKLKEENERLKQTQGGALNDQSPTQETPADDNLSSLNVEPEVNKPMEMESTPVEKSMSNDEQPSMNTDNIMDVDKSQEDVGNEDDDDDTVNSSGTEDLDTGTSGSE